MAQKRTHFLDLLRIIACFLVIVNHTNSGVFQAVTPDATRWYISVAYFFVSKIAVPLFFMISGYLLLNNVDSWKKTFIRILRILAALLVCAVVYAAYNAFFESEQFVLDDMIAEILQVYKEIPSNALWYLYTYFGVLLMLPYLQKMAQSMTKTDYHIFFLISGFTVSLLPILEHYNSEITINEKIYLPLFSGYICLLFIGQYFSRFGIKKTIPGFCTAVLLFALMLGFNVTATYFEYQADSSDFLFFDNRLYLPIMVQAVCVFYLTSFFPFGPKMGRFISWVGSCTFGIYLMSDLIIDLLEPHFIALQMVIHPLWAVLIYELCVFVIGLVVTAVLKIIPLVKKIL